MRRNELSYAWMLPEALSLIRERLLCARHHARCRGFSGDRDRPRLCSPGRQRETK